MRTFGTYYIIGIAVKRKIGGKEDYDRDDCIFIIGIVIWKYLSCLTWKVGGCDDSLSCK